MFEKVNPSHPDKLADRIAGAIVDLAYETEDNPKIAVEVLIGHGICHIIAESSVDISKDSVRKIVSRIVDDTTVDFVLVQQGDGRLGHMVAQSLIVPVHGGLVGIIARADQGRADDQRQQDDAADDFGADGVFSLHLVSPSKTTVRVL